MKLFLVFALLNFCNCEISLPDGISEAKDALEAEGNRKSFEHFKKIAEDGEEKKIEGKNVIMSHR